MKPTPEQSAIFDSQAGVLKIKAGAGTGKTTTLRGLAHRHGGRRMLYLAFNKAIKEEAQAKFPRNVRAVTAHGLAYGRIGKHYGNTPDKLSGDLKPFHVLPALKDSLKGMPPAMHNLYGGRVIETLKAYLVSADAEMDQAHVALGASPGEKKHFDGGKILADARNIWTQMADLRQPMPMIHDGYLKLFQLEQPELPYDVILLDEAQDTNPVTQALVWAQHARQAYVGDEHQAIYGWRGARNAMALIEADEDHLLTGSFRFGRAVAEVANAILSAKGETELRLRGLGGPSRVGRLAPNTPHAFIARGNSALFGRAVAAIEARERFAFVGPLYSYRLDLIEQTYALSRGLPTTDAFLKAFDSFEALDEYAQALEDREWMGRCNLVKRYGARLPRLVAQIQAQAGTYPGPGSFHVVLTTAHRAKGLEFDHVVMADDFMDFFDEDNGQWRDLTQASEREREEVNLQYVAATRARKALEVGQKLGKFLAEQAKAGPLNPGGGAGGNDTETAAPARVVVRTAPQPRFPAPGPARPASRGEAAPAGAGRPTRAAARRMDAPNLGRPGRPGSSQRA